MSTFPYCCDTNTLYLGLDSQCNKPAVLCTLHASHPNPTGIMHNIMPITHFRSVVNELKFQMSDKVSNLIQKYINFMDDLINQVTELKVRKSIEMSTLWVRELAQTEQEYEQFKKIFRNDFQGFTCRQIANFYDKMLRGVNIKQKKLDDIQCYKQIDRVMDKLQNSAKARILIVQKVADLQGIVQNGDLLKRALPDRKVLKENTRQILLETHNPSEVEIRYNKASLKKGGVNYHSLFSKYSLIPNTNYHLTINTKYANVLIGVCSQAAKKTNQSADLHYNVHSLTYNCSNGCVYRDAMFESGSAHLTKNKKNLQLILRVNDTQMLILMDKNVVCRIKLKQFAKSTLYLHVLMRTEGDSFEIDSDKMNSFEPTLKPQPAQSQSVIQVIDVNNISSDEILKQSIDKFMPRKDSEQENEKRQREEQQFVFDIDKQQPKMHKYNTFGQTHNPMVQLLKKPNSNNYQKGLLNINTKNYLESGAKSIRPQSIINIQASLSASNDNEEFVSMKKNTKLWDKASQKQVLAIPALMTPLRKSQFEQDLKDVSNIQYLPSIKFIPKINSAVQQHLDLKIIQLQSSQSI